MYLNYRKYIEIVIQLQNINYFSGSNKIQIHDMYFKQACAAEIAVLYAALPCKQNKRYVARPQG